MTSRLAQMQAKFQQKQIQEREEKLVRLYENQQQKAFERVNRGSAGSNTSLGSTGGGKVRQMFDERRQKAGIDRSYPLEPLKTTKPSGQIRGGSVDRIKNATTKTVVKSTVQTSVNHVRNGKQVANKQEVIHSVYNNNNGNEFYDEQTITNDHFDKTFHESHTDIIEMINTHNLNDSLDNEEMPQLGFDEPDESMYTGKLTNLGGKLPSETIRKTKEKSTTKPTRNSLGQTFRKESKPIIKRTVRPALSPQNLAPSTSVQSQPSKTTSSTLSSPVRSVSQTMQSVSKTSPIKKGTPQPPQSSRTPCNTRPSTKQSAKSPVARDDLNECKHCNRRFAADRLELHESICGKTMKKKRKTYDATKHRIEGTDLEQYTRRGKHPSSKSNKQTSSKKDWRRTHEEFITAIRAAKMAQAHVAKGGKLSDLPPPPPSSNPDYVQCPHCGRKFNESAAERHIPKCVNYSFNKPKPGAAPKGKVSAKNGR